jgi:hypothetical protein
MANILTFNQVIDVLQDIAQRHYQINTFFLGRDWELENNNDITYPVLQVYPEFARMPQTNGDFKTLNVRLICKVVDLVNQNESNEKDVHSDTLRIAQDIVNEINQHPYYQHSNANIIGDIDFTSLEEYEDDFAAGWEFTLNLQLINNNSYCGLPFEELPGYSASGPVSSGYSYSVQYLTCDNLTACTSFQDYVATAIDNLPEIEIPTNLTFFSTTSASDVVGYSKLVISLDDPNYNVVPINVSTGPITTTGQLVGSLISDAGIFAGNPGTINISTVGEIRRTGGSGVAEFYYEVYQRNSLGVETLICTSNKTAPITTSVYQQFQASALFNNGTWLDSDRVVIKYYAYRIPSGSNPTYNFLFGGTNPTRTLFPISAQLLLNVPITIGITGVVSGTTDYILTVDSNGKLSQIDPNLATFTIELIDNSTVYFYAPDDLRINTVTIINGTGTETIEVNDAPYALTNLINQGDKITISITTPSVLNLNSRYE